MTSDTFSGAEAPSEQVFSFPWLGNPRHAAETSPLTPTWRIGAVSDSECEESVDKMEKEREGGERGEIASETSVSQLSSSEAANASDT